jgi:hypothetical protein
MSWCLINNVRAVFTKEKEKRWEQLQSLRKKNLNNKKLTNSKHGGKNDTKLIYKFGECEVHGQEQR